MTKKAIRAAILKLKPVSIDRIAFAESSIKKLLEAYPFWTVGAPLTDKQVIETLDKFEEAFDAFQAALTELAAEGAWSQLVSGLQARDLPMSHLRWLNESQEFRPLLEVVQATSERIRIAPKVRRSRPANRNAITLARFLVGAYEDLTGKLPPIGLEANRSSAFGTFVAAIFNVAGEAGDPAYFANMAAKRRGSKGGLKDTFVRTSVT